MVCCALSPNKTASDLLNSFTFPKAEKIRKYAAPHRIVNTAIYGSFSSVSPVKLRMSSDSDIVENARAAGMSNDLSSAAFAPVSLIILTKREQFPKTLLA